MFLSFIEVVILTIILGFVFKKLFPKQTQRMVAFLPAFSSVMIALIVGIIVSANVPKLLTGGLLIVLVVMLHNICGLSLGYLVGRALRLPHHK